MEIPWSSIATGAVPVVTAVVALVGLTRGPGALRSRLRHDVELLEKLPDDSAARAAMLDLVKAQVDRVAKLETDASRDMSGLVIGALMTIASGGVAVFLIQLETWWSYVLATLPGFVALVCIYGVFESAQLVPRDSKGKRI